jgi:hypothetical protein
VALAFSFAIELAAFDTEASGSKNAGFDYSMLLILVAERAKSFYCSLIASNMLSNHGVNCGIPFNVVKFTAGTTANFRHESAPAIRTKMAFIGNGWIKIENKATAAQTIFDVFERDLSEAFAIKI